jgi:hypothetical protein
LYTFRLASSFNMDSLLAYMVTPLDDILHAQTSQTDAVTTEPTGALDQATALFQTAARDVPAYRALIAEHGIKDAAGLSFKEAPYATKDNYFNKHPLESRCYGGSLSSADFVHQSSGRGGGNGTLRAGEAGGQRQRLLLQCASLAVPLAVHSVCLSRGALSLPGKASSSCLWRHC